MYLGQEGWAQPGAAKGQQRGGVVAPTRPAQAGEVGQAPRITISGCKHDVVGPIIRGDFTMAQMNHGKPAYKKDAGANGLVVMIYFWDERDGAASSGWWIGPQIGGNMVWGHHPNRTSATPPTSGWQAPHSAPPDNSLVVSAIQQPGGRPAAGASAAHQPPQFAALNGHPQQQQHQQQQQQQQQHAQQAQQQQHAQQAQQQQQQQHQQQQQQRQVMQQQQQLQQQQQQQQQRAQWEEQRRKLEDANRQRLDDQQKRLEQQRKQQDELQRKRQEEQQKRQQEVQRQQVEQRSAVEIRKVIQKLKAVTPENFERLKEELAAVLGKEFDSCGSQKIKVQEESDKALEQAAAKIEQIKEQRKKNEERQKELEVKRQEALEAAQKLLAELSEMAAAAEEAAKELEESVTGFNEESGLSTAAQVADAAKPVEEAGKSAAEKAQVCLDFLKTKGVEMKVLSTTPAREMASKQGAQEPKKEEAPAAAAEERPSLAKVTQRVGVCKHSVDKALKAFEAAKGAALKKASATDVMKKLHALFAKYDKDKDGLLNRKEIGLYARGEYSFALPDDSLDLISKVIVAEGLKGVKEEDFHRLQAAVGVSRERARDRERKAAREAREAVLAEQKTELRVSVDAAAAAAKLAEQEVVEAGKQSRGLPAEGKTLGSPAMFRRAEEIEGLVKGATERLAAAKKLLEELGGEGQAVEKELKPWLDGEKRKLQVSMKNFETQLNKATVAVERFREEATKKDVVELKGLTAKALALVKAHQAKQSLQSGALFAEVCGKGRGSLEAADFVAFLQKLAGEAEKQQGEEPKPAEAEALSEEDLARVFAGLDEEKTGSLSEEAFSRILRVLMKVVKDIVITQGKSIKESSPLRRLELNEVIEVLEGPIKEDESEITRVRAKTMKDGLVGWVTVAGNQGTHFIKEGGGIFKVVKETILTDSFDILATKEESRKIKDTTRKLKPGELLEVREWEKKDETGLLRMKCKALADGEIGYVTTTGNTGIKFVEIA